MARSVNRCGWFVFCRLLNQSYLLSIGVNFLPGYADPFKGRFVIFIPGTHSSQFAYYGRPAQQMRTLYFCPVVSFCLLSFFYSSPNLRGRRLDVYHTSTHGVALVRIQNAGLKCAARGSLEIHDAKNRHLHTIAQYCRAISSQLKHILTIGKKLVKQQYLLHMSLLLLYYYCVCV